MSLADVLGPSPEWMASAACAEVDPDLHFPSGEHAANLAGQSGVRGLPGVGAVSRVRHDRTARGVGRTLSRRAPRDPSPRDRPSARAGPARGGAARSRVREGRMTTSIQTHVDRFTRSEANRRLSAVLVWLPELVAITLSTVLAVGVSLLTGSTAATSVALLPAALSALRIGWANLQNYRRARAARRMRRQHQQSSDASGDDAEVVALDQRIAADGVGGQS